MGWLPALAADVEMRSQAVKGTVLESQTRQMHRTAEVCSVPTEDMVRRRPELVSDDTDQGICNVHKA